MIVMIAVMVTVVVSIVTVMIMVPAIFAFVESTGWGSVIPRWW